MDINNENKEDNFKQTIIQIRVENRQYLKSASALKDMAMYELLDEILNEKRKEYIKNFKEEQLTNINTI